MNRLLKNIKKPHWALLLLLAVSAMLLSGAWHLLTAYPDSGVHGEFGKLLISLGGGVIIGGVIKFLLDVYTEEKERKEASKAFRIGLLNDLRAVADEVTLAKILIRSHQSAKTYGACMRDKIMPACIRLWEVKRTLVDKDDPFLRGAVLDIRAHIHAMIAYLKALMKEFEDHYIEISNLQRYQEFAQSQAVKTTDFELTAAKDLPRFSHSWDKIIQLHFLEKFINHEEDGTKEYENFFFGHYRACKDLMKDGKEQNRKGATVLSRYEELRKKIRSNTTLLIPVDTAIYGGDLVEWILYEELEYYKKRPENPSDEFVLSD